MKDEWLATIAGDRLVKFTFADLPGGGAFLTAQIAGHEVVYSIISEEEDCPFNRVNVERRFAYEFRLPST